MKNFYKKPSEYSQIPNSFAQDNNLTIEARGLGLLIYSLPDDWVFRQVWFYSKAGPFKNRAKTVIPALNELKTYNYLASIQVRAARGKFDDAKWMFDPSGNAYKCLIDILNAEGYAVDCTENTHSNHGAENTSSVDATSVDATSNPIKEIETNLKRKKEISSSSPSPPFPEEENNLVIAEIINVVNPYANLPDEIDGLPRSIVVEEIEAIAKERGGDFYKYRLALVNEILSGGGRTMMNICNRLSKMTRERGEQMQAALQAHGFANTFDYYEKDLGHEQNA